MKKVFVLLTCLFFPGFVFAYSSDEIITDEYVYSSLEGSNKQLTNIFVYRDADFTRSSFIGSKSLETLSIQVAAASLSRWGMNEDIYEADYRENDYNIKLMLNQMKFNDIKSNAYYNAEKKPNSVGVIIGSKKIIQDDKEYTLLAIIPRSAGYRLEWSGNFNIGDGDIHAGFKAARDEIIRFTKKYITENNITGDLKIWTTGYSRGAAISNSVGGFFAGGGISYFGDSVRLTPEDVYCYTIGTPSNVKDGISKNIELSVEGKRNSDTYANDTEGLPYTYTGGGTLDLSSDVYKGVRSVIFEDDAFALLPPSAWGFTRYGTVVKGDEGILSEEEMLKDLKSISDYGYGAAAPNGVIEKFYRKKFDLTKVEAINDEEISKLDFVQERFSALTTNIPTNEDFYNNYEEAARAAISVFGTTQSMSAKTSTKSITNPLLYSFLAYETETLINNDPNISNEKEAVEKILLDIIKEYTGETIPDNFTVDGLIELIAKFLTEHENEPVMEKAVSAIAEYITDDSYSLLKGMLDLYLAEPEKATKEDSIKAFLKACYEGPMVGSSNYEDGTTPKTARATLFMIIYLGLYMSEDIDSDAPIVEFIYNEMNSLSTDGEGSTFKEFIDVWVDYLETDKTADGDPITYANLGEVADASFQEYFDDYLLNDLIVQSESIYGSEFKLDLLEQYIGLRNNISKVRKVISWLFFYNEDGYDIEKTISNALTLVDNITSILVPHFEDLYLAYSRNSSRYPEEYYLIKGDDQTINVARNKPLEVVFNFNHYEFKERGKVYIDGVEIPKDKYTISKGSTIITLNRDYLSTLSLGNHVLTAEIDDHQVDAEFTLNYQKNPKTGDNLYIYICLLIASSFILIKRKA